MVLDSGDSDSGTLRKLIPNQDIYDKVKELADGTPNVGADGKEHSFYSVEYGKVLWIHQTLDAREHSIMWRLLRSLRRSKKLRKEQLFPLLYR
jgi:hypothetical protein